MHTTNSRILPVIVTAQFFCTSLWFAGNAILPDLALHNLVTENALGHLVSAVQFGFIAGTLFYALLQFADRFPPSVVFCCSAILAAGANVFIVFTGTSLATILFMRFLTGFFLAGIYPVGMKIAADYFEKGLGKALGFLVGALVVGTALPHLVQHFTGLLPWKTVMYITSGLSVAGGLLMLLLVPAGPFQKKNPSLRLDALFSVFKNKGFRSAVSGYFGHMWELYAFWAFVPVILAAYNNMYPQTGFNIHRLSFFIIASGGLACIAGGYIAQRAGTAKTAFTALFLSGCCCLLSPLAFYLPPALFLVFLIFWGLVVIADSPLFSTLVAQKTEWQLKGTALTLATCIGFSITIGSIELLGFASAYMPVQYIFMLLAIGPLAGLISMRTVKNETL